MIPEEFTKRMKKLLGEQFSSFEKAINRDAVRALRVNTLKMSAANFEEKADFPLEKIEEIEGGYIFKEEKVGAKPLHHAGAFYVQDPSAMATVAAARDYIEDGMKILDLCAAPGGKSTQLAALCPNGFILSNEINGARARILRGNMERMGVKRSALTNTTAESLAREFPEEFDFVLCDAPCSGEGMFRKYNEEVLENWSVENVEMCAARQREILDFAAKCVKNGGFLLYSTCTFNTEENEETVLSFLNSHGDFRLVEASEKIRKITAEGALSEKCAELKKCRRFYPHLSEGEGQFIAIMKKDGERIPSENRIINMKKPPKQDEKIATEFFSKAMGKVPEGFVIYSAGNNIMLLPENAVCPEKSLYCGVVAGEVVKGRFVPHHHLFSAFGKDFLIKAELSGADVEKYLRGETVSAEVPNGWCAVLVEGCPVGGGKAVDGVVKNHYPKGLRLLR